MSSGKKSDSIKTCSYPLPARQIDPGEERWKKLGPSSPIEFPWILAWRSFGIGGGYQVLEMSYFYRILNMQITMVLTWKQYRNLWKIDRKVAERLLFEFESIAVLSHQPTNQPTNPQHKQSSQKNISIIWTFFNAVCGVFLISYQTHASNILLCNLDYLPDCTQWTTIENGMNKL